MLILTAAQHGWPLQALPEQQVSQALEQDGYPARWACVLASPGRYLRLQHLLCHSMKHMCNVCMVQPWCGSLVQQCH